MLSSSDKKENIFDLTKMPIEIKHVVKKPDIDINIETQDKLTKGFVEIPPEEWDSFKYNDFIRYLRNDGSFRKGGYFKNSWVGNYGKSNGKKCIQLSSVSKFGGKTWQICHSDVSKIWKGKNKVEHSGSEQKINNEMSEILNENNESIQFLTKSVEQIKTDILRINNEQKRIINLIKKLHNIHIKK